jgi:hypothetical protein
MNQSLLGNLCHLQIILKKESFKIHLRKKGNLNSKFKSLKYGHSIQTQ